MLKLKKSIALCLMPLLLGTFSLGVNHTVNAENNVNEIMEQMLEEDEFSFDLFSENELKTISEEGLEVDIDLEDLTDTVSMEFFGMSAEEFVSNVTESFQENNPNQRWASGVTGKITHLYTDYVPGTGNDDAGSTFRMLINGETVFGACYHHQRYNPPVGAIMVQGERFDGDEKVGLQLARMLTDAEKGTLGTWQSALAAHAIIAQEKTGSPTAYLWDGNDGWGGWSEYFAPARNEINNNPTITKYYTTTPAKILGVDVKYSAKNLTMPIALGSDGWRYSGVTKITLVRNEGKAKLTANGATIFVKEGGVWVNKGTSTTVSNNTEVRYGTQKETAGTFSSKVTAKGPDRIPDFVQSFTPQNPNAPVGKYQNLVFLRTKDSADTDTLTGTFPESNGNIIVKKTDASGKALNGATFQVINSSNTVVETLNVTSNGTVTSKKLPVGTYSVKETKAPTDYKLDSTPKQVNVTGGNTSTVTFVNQALPGKIKLIKKNENGSKTLSGAVYKIYSGSNTSGALVDTVTTGSDGTIVSKDLPEGTYTISETKAPSNYYLDNTSKTVTVPKNRTTEVEFRNKFHQGWGKVTKMNPVGGKLFGAEYSIYKGSSATGTAVATLKTDSTGTATTPKLDIGTYTIKETKAPFGYTLSSVTKTFDIKVDQTTNVDFYNQSLPLDQLLIFKLSETFQERIKIAGTTFRMTGNPMVTDENGNPTTKKVDIVFTLDDFGEYNFSPQETKDITYGTYELEELASPEGYVKLKDKITVEYTDKTGKELAMDIINETQKGTFKVIKETNKLDINGINIIKGTERLKGAEFDVFVREDIRLPGTQTVFKAGTKVDHIVTDANGEAISNGNGLSKRVFSGDTGLEVGKYYIKETKAPNGYKPDTKTEYDVEIKANNEEGQNGEHISEVPVITVKNSLKLGKLSITKKGDTYRNPATKVEYVNKEVLLANAEFDVYTAEVIKLDGITTTIDKDVKLDTLITDKKGKATSTELPKGKYYLVETKSPEGYLLEQNKKYPTEILEEHTNNVNSIPNITVYNKLQLGKFELTKTGDTINESYSHVGDESGIEKHYFKMGIVPLKGAEFDIFTRFEVEIKGTNKTIPRDTLIGRVESDEEGKVYSPELLPGQYYIKETKAPNGFVLDTKPINVEIKYNDEEAQQGKHISEIPSLTKHNELQKVELNMIKEGEELDKFTPENPRGFSTRKVPLSGVMFGVYTNEEIMDLNGEVILGKDKLVGYETSDSEGKIKITETLPFAKYYFKEMNTDNIHVLNTEIFEFDLKAINDKGIRKLYVYQDGISDDKEDKTLTPMENDLFRTRFQIKKLAEIGEHDKDGWTFNIEESSIVEGTEFELTTEEGIFVQTLVINEDLTATSNELPVGNYILKETKAPNKDYSLNEELYNLEWKITITKEETTMIQLDDGQEVESTEVVLGTVTRFNRIPLEIGEDNKLPEGSYSFELIEKEDNIEESPSTPSDEEDISPMKDVELSEEEDTILGTVTKELENEETIIKQITTHNMTNKLFISEKDSLNIIEIPENYELFAIELDNLIQEEIVDETPTVLVDGEYSIGERNDIPEGIYTLTGDLGMAIKVTPSDKDKENLPVDSEETEITQEIENEIEDEETNEETNEEVIIIDEELLASEDKEIVLSEGDTLLVEGEGEISLTPVKTNELVPQFTITNYLKKGEFDFTKTDVSTGKPLEGAIIEIIGITNDTYITFESLVVGNRFTLPEGTYIFKETVAPDGYVLSTEVGTFTIEDGKVTKAKLHNVRPGKLKFQKTDVSSGKLLKGAEIQIKGKTNDTDIKFVTDGTEQTFELEEGTYEFSETLAPRGYQKTTEKGIFTIEDGKITKAKLHNKRVAETGSILTNKYVIGATGLLLLVSSIGAYYIIRKRK